MKRLRNYLRQPRFFLSIIVLPLLIGKGECPPIFLPPPPVQGCQINVPVTLAARKCAVVEATCPFSVNWQPGDSHSIIRSSGLFFNIQSISSGSNTMRRVCQNSTLPVFSGTNGSAVYEYTFQNTVGQGTYSINFINRTMLTVSASNSSFYPSVYDRVSSGRNVIVYGYVEDNLSVPTHLWTANGAIIPSEVTGSVSQILPHRPSRNTEYKVQVTDGAGRQASDAVVVFVTDLLTGNPMPGDPAAAFTISPAGVIQTGQTVTLDPSGSAGGINRWEWDFDWKGDILEPFDAVVNGTNGARMFAWNQPGRKYIRLRVTTAAGNFHEIFQRITVIPAS